MHNHRVLNDMKPSCTITFTAPIHPNHFTCKRLTGASQLAWVLGLMILNSRK